jgi:hypothetical protein
MPDATLAGNAAHDGAPGKAALDKNALIDRIGKLLLTDPAVDAVPWNAYALIVRYGEPHLARRITGFRYLDDGSHEAATPRSEALGPALDALREATRVADKAPWDACVFRLRRDTRKLHVEFEYDSPERWDIAPETLHEVVGRAKPSKRTE